MTIYNNILETIGRTPIVKLQRIAPKHISLYAKIESFNPGGSVKDRLALGVILDAENKGLIKHGDTICECTSGNVGIAFAMVAAARGYNFVAVMADSFSVERRKIIKAYGGKIILYPGKDKISGGNKIADQLSKKHGWFRPLQFDNLANPNFHRLTTASEILSDFADKKLDYFVTGSGTGGTVTGVGQMMKLARPEVKIIVTEPDNAALIAGKTWNPHKIQGWGPDIIPSILDTSIIDQLVTVDQNDSRDAAIKLAQEEGIFVGISAGGSIATCLEIAKNAPNGTVILTILPDTGERYLSTFLTEGMNEESDDEWLKQL